MQPFLRLTKMGFDGVAEGVIACQEPDHDGEILDYFGSKPYIQNWSNTQLKNSGGKSYGNVRVQHQADNIAGFLQSITFDDANKEVRVSAKVIDPVARQMLQEGALTGFSIGGSYVKKTPLSNGLISYIANPVEISIVDRPCSPSATFSLVHADGSKELRKFQKVWSRDEITSRILSLLKSGATEAMVSIITGATAGTIYLAKRQNHQRTITNRRAEIRKSRGWQG